VKDFTGRYAVVTGGGSGIGRELVRALAALGCNVAMCDVSAAAMEATIAACDADGMPDGVRIIAHVADVSSEPDVLRFADEIGARMNTDSVHLLFNNAGIGAGASMFTDSRANWERTFNVCWYGVYYMVRAFLPMMVRADQGHIVNVSSVNGFWASLGPMQPQTAYSAAKFAVKGFTEALITDLRVNAPHIKCSVVMPGHIGTNIVANTRMVLAGRDTTAPTQKDIDRARRRLAADGVDVATLDDEAIAARIDAAQRAFIAAAPMCAAEAAAIILDAVREERWRVLVGQDAQRVDALVRADPERAYDADFNVLTA
jgi:NAD(P)-dependent dehydrogenase (short-subunit alcohol dehydrogenase family)